MDDKKSEYLSYVRVLYERESNKGKQSGVTKWGVIIALVYIVWNLIDSYPKVRDDSIAFYSAIFMYGFLQLSVDYFSTFFNLPLGGTNNSKFDIRIRGKGFASEYVNYLIIIILMLGLPLLSQFCRDASILNVQSVSTSIRFIEIQVSINFYALSFLIIATAAYLLFNSIYERIKRYPSPLIFNSRTKGKKTQYMLMFFSLEMAFGNAIAFYMLLNYLPLTVLQPVLTFTFDLVLIVLAIKYLSSSTFQNGRIEKISSLERDIIFHELSTDEIKKRIQEEFIGHEFGEWLKNKVNEVRKEAAALHELSEKSIELRAGIEALSKELEYEKNGRLNKFMDELESRYKSYNKKFSPLVNWISIVIANNGNYEQGLISTIKEVFEDIKVVHDLTVKKTKTTMAEIRAVLKSESINS